MALFKNIKNQVKGQIRDALNNAAKNVDPEPVLSDERPLSKKDIFSIQTFTQAKSFKGFRRVTISTDNLDGVEKNMAFFRSRDFDFTNCAVQVMVVKARNDEGKCLRIVADGRFLGNVYKNISNYEAFDMAVNQKLDKVYLKYEDAVIDGKLYGTNTYIMFHWPNIAPKIKVTVE